MIKLVYSLMYISAAQSTVTNYKEIHYLAPFKTSGHLKHSSRLSTSTVTVVA